MKEDNKLVKWLKSINYKSAFVYFIVIQVAALACTTFLSMAIVPLLRFAFTEANAVREVAEIITMLLLEMLIRLLLFYAFFRNDRSLVFKEFAESYGVTVALRLVTSTIFYFASWSAGITICLTGSFLGRLWVDENIKTMREVPFWLYFIVFTVFEALVYLVAYFAHKMAKRQREKVKQELMKENEGN